MSRAFRRWIFGSLVDQRGGTLVMGLMLVFIMTLLGVALFDMARLEARLKLDSQTGVQALEIAEAGLERGLHLLYLEFVCGPNTASPINVANCLNPPTDPNYIIDNTLPLEGVRKALTTDCPASLLPDGATGFKLLKADQVFGLGSYTLCVRQWPDPNTDPPNQPSTNHHKAQFRSRGALTSVTGTAARIVQIDATADVTANKPHSPFAFGGTAGGIRGNALIAGSLQFVSCPGAGCVAVSFGGGGGMQNNYTGLNASLHDRIPWRFQDGTTVNTLGAVLKVRQGQVKLDSGSACIGKQESGSGCSGGGTPFQDTMSGVYTSGTWGGSKGNCSGGLNGNTTTNSRCNVWTSAQGPYPTGEPTSIPLLSDSTIIDGKGYRCFFNPPGSTCPNTADPIPGGTNFDEYFYSSAWRIDNTSDGRCDISVAGVAHDCTIVLAALQTGSVPDFGAGPVTTLPIKSGACVRQGAADPNSCTLQIAAGQMFGIIDGLPIRPDLEPINVYVKRLASAGATTPTVKTSPVDAATDNNMYYQGKMIILADNPAVTPGFEIDTGLLPAWLVAAALSGPGAGGTWALLTTYYWRLLALDSTGAVIAASVEAKVAVDDATKKVTLTWTAVTGAVSYRLYRSTASGVFTSPALVTTVGAVTTVDDLGAAVTIGASLEPVTCTVNQSWCSLGPYLCGYCYPANHFVAMLTTGDILLGAGGPRDILGQFFAANTGLTARFYVNGGIGQTQVAGTVSAQQFDFTLAGSAPSLYQAPWNLGALPGAAGPAAGAFVSIVSSNWAQIQ